MKIRTSFLYPKGYTSTIGTGTCWQTGFMGCTGFGEENEIFRLESFNISDTIRNETRLVRPHYLFPIIKYLVSVCIARFIALCRSVIEEIWVAHPGLKLIYCRGSPDTVRIMMFLSYQHWILMLPARLLHACYVKQLFKSDDGQVHPISLYDFTDVIRWQFNRNSCTNDTLL